MRCLVPTFVREYVNIISWLKDDKVLITASTNNGEINYCYFIFFLISLIEVFIQIIFCKTSEMKIKKNKNLQYFIKHEVLNNFSLVIIPSFKQKKHFFFLKIINLDSNLNTCFALKYFFRNKGNNCNDFSFLLLNKS